MSRAFPLIMMISFCSLFSVSPSMAEDTSKKQQLVKEARTLIKSYAGQLKAALSHSMKTEGPIAAIDVCARKSPEIAVALSETSSWNISRTSLKARNSASEPDHWEKSVLESFEQRLKNGESIKNLDHVAVTENGTVFRYMKAIPTQKLCLTCHGSDISPELQESISSYYPDDMATGFNSGDIRGAFTLQKDLSQ